MANELEPLDPLLTEAISELRDCAPSTDLWPAIAPRLKLRRPKGAILLRWPAALAAGITIAICSAGGTVLFQRSHQPAGAGAVGSPAPLATVAYSSADSTLAGAINDLERSLRATMAQLDGPARAGIAQSFTALDRAIRDAAQRVADAPDDPRAGRYLTATLRKKLNVLRTVSTLTARRS